MTAAMPTYTPPDLNGRHQRTYEAIFRHPAAHDLEWHDVRSLLDAVADVVEGANSSLKATRNGKTVNLNVPKHKDVATVEDLMAVRHFLQQSDEKAAPHPAVPGANLVVVIDHHEARVFHAEPHSGVPQRLVPYDPHGYGRHLHSHNQETDGKRTPERKSYYEAVAATLRGAGQIVLFGHGTGEGSAMDQLVADLKKNHSDVAGHIVGAVVVDGRQADDGALLNQARELFAAQGV